MTNTTPWIMTAPMEGVVDAHTRWILASIGGIQRTTTEFIRVTDQLLPEHVFYKYCPELHSRGETAQNTPVFVQLLGGQAQPLADNAARAFHLGAKGIDLNFGCPAPTVNRHDGGAALLKTPSRLFDIVSAVRTAVPSTCPVTAKMRLGFDHKDLHLDLAQAAEAGGANEVTIHARTKTELYRPPAHWEYIANIKIHLKIPVIANGEIWTFEDYLRCREISGCDKVALGRGLLAHPRLAQEITEKFMSRIENRAANFEWSFALEVLIGFFEKLSFQSERLALSRTKQWCQFLLKKFPEALELFKTIKVCEKIEDMRLMLYKTHSTLSEYETKRNA